MVELRIKSLGPERDRLFAQLRTSQHRRIQETGSLGVNLTSERGTTRTAVKVPKYRLSVKGRRASIVRDSEEVGLEAATL